MANFRKKTLLELVQKEANYRSLEDIQPMYYALLRALLKELMQNGSVIMPDWGEFKLTVHKARRMNYVNEPGRMMDIPPKATVKFRPCEKLKVYAKSKHDSLRGGNSVV